MQEREKLRAEYLQNKMHLLEAIARYGLQRIFVDIDDDGEYKLTIDAIVVSPTGVKIPVNLRRLAASISKSPYQKTLHSLISDIVLYAVEHFDSELDVAPDPSIESVYGSWVYDAEKGFTCKLTGRAVVRTLLGEHHAATPHEWIQQEVL